MAVTPFDNALAEIMKKAGCVGIDFTGDSASPLILANLRQQHTREDLASAVQLCRENSITVMIDLLFGGPGETPETVRETIEFIKGTQADCIGAPLGILVYPGTQMSQMVALEGPMESNPCIKRKYDGPVDLFKPTFYISDKLGERPAEIIKESIGKDKRFFKPISDIYAEATDHNYNDNSELTEAIAGGARGAYWDILRKLRS